MLFTWAPNADRGISLLCAPTPSYKGAGLMDMHTHTYIHIHTHHTHMRIHVHTYTHKHTYIHIHKHIHKCTHEYIYTCAHIHTCTYVHIYTCMYVHTRAYTHTHMCMYPLSDSVTEAQGRDTPRGKPPFDLGSPWMSLFCPEPHVSGICTVSGFPHSAVGLQIPRCHACQCLVCSQRCLRVR